MKRSAILFSLVCLLSACAPASKNYQELEQRVLDASTAQSILIQVDHGEVTVLEAKDSHLTVAGKVLDGNQLEYSVDAIGDQILVKMLTHGKGSGGVPLDVQIQVPSHKKVRIETEDASLNIQGFQGSLVVASTAGDVTVERMIGSMAVNSNRGKIKVRESSGEIQVVGNYGAISLEDVSGKTAASTIMGDITLRGPIQGGDTVHLETDHGSVTVNLSTDFALSLQVHSTSGEVTCLLSDVISSTRTCSRELSSGGGNLSVRTVSGAVLLQLTP